MRELFRRKQQTQCLAYSPDGRQLAVGGWTGRAARIDVWDLAGAGRPVTLPALDAPLEGLAFTPAGLVVQTNRDVRLYTGPAYKTAETVREWNPAKSHKAAVSPDGTRLLLTDERGATLRALAGRFPALWRREFPERLITAPGAAFAPDGREFAIGIGWSYRRRGRVEVWAAEDGATRRAFARPETSVSLFKLIWSADGRWVAEVWQQLLYVWNARTGRLVWDRSAFRPGERTIEDAVFHPPTGDLIVAFQFDPVDAGEWDADDDSDDADEYVLIRVYPAGKKRERAAYRWPVTAEVVLAAAPDGLTAAAGGSDGKVVVWDLDG